MGNCGPWGRAGEALLGATLFGTAGRRPNLDYGLRATAEAAWHNATKPHRLPNLWNAGRERASGAAGPGGPEQAPSRNKYLKAPLAVDSEPVGRVAGHKWTRGVLQSWSSHADKHGGVTVPF